MLGLGKPTRSAFNDRDFDALDAACEPTERLLCFSVPRMVKCDKDAIDQYVAVYKKVTDNYRDLLAGDSGTSSGGRWVGFASSV